jgi:YfiH family protein
VSEFYAVGEHLGVDLPGARAVFTTRHGGVSSGPYASLNLGRFTDDDPGAVRANRERLEAALGVGFAYGRQVHGPLVMRVDRPSWGEPVEADGQATTTSGVAPLVLTADCLPIALAGGGAVAMLHAGWRGLASGVIEEGVAAVRELGAGGVVAAAIGPGAGPCCYEVGEEVHAAFDGHDNGVSRSRPPSNIDLKAIAAEQLRRAGVEDVFDVDICTICNGDFFSHRRDAGITGRQAGIAWLT